jgi:hypothetical protein
MFIEAGFSVHLLGRPLGGRGPRRRAGFFAHGVVMGCLGITEYLRELLVELLFLFLLVYWGVSVSQSQSLAEPHSYSHKIV